MSRAADPRGRLAAAWHWAVHDQGSTRPVALLRIFTVLLLWTKWGGVGALFLQYPNPEKLVVGVLFYLVTGLMLLGLWTRPATLMTALLIGYGYHVLGVEGGERGPWVHHHTQLLKWVVWLLVLTPCGRSLSLDRLIALRRARRAGSPPPAELAPLWGQRLLQLQAASVYFWATEAKLSLAFFSGARTESIFAEFYFGAEIPDAPWFHLLAAVISTGTVLLEATLCVAMLWPRIQRWALPAGALMHLAFYMLLPVSTYTATMVAIYITVIPPERVHRFIDELLGHGSPHAPEPVPGDLARP